MEQGLQIFNHPQFGEIRAVMIDGEPWLVATDICKAISIGNPTQAVSRLDEDERTLISNEGSKSGLPVNVVNEAGLYALVLGSRKKEARDFKRWVTHEVLPSIRKHGAYVTPAVQNYIRNNPDFLISLATKIKEEQQRVHVLQIENEGLRQKNEELKPKALFADAVSVSKSEILVGQLAKILRQNGIEVGRNRLFEILRREGYLIREKGRERSLPTQKSLELGLFRVKETTVHANGEVIVSATPYVTGKGQTYFLERFLNGKITV